MEYNTGHLYLLYFVYSHLQLFGTYKNEELARNKT